MTIKNGDKAATPFQPSGPDGLPTHEPEFGLTKREIMAMHMMAHLMPIESFTSYEDQASHAIKAVDALLAELEHNK